MIWTSKSHFRSNLRVPAWEYFGGTFELPRDPQESSRRLQEAPGEVQQREIVLGRVAPSFSALGPLEISLSIKSEGPSLGDLWENF